MFVLDQPTKAKLHKSDDKSIKVGQKDTKDAVIVNYMAVLPNTILDVLDPSGNLRAALYRQASAAEKAKRKQGSLDGVEEATELTETGVAIGTLPWSQEQTGCTLTIEHGLGGKSNLILKDGTSKTKKVALQEGGSVKVYAQFHAPTDHFSDEVLGKLHRLHQKEVKLLLEGPKVEQLDVEDEGGSTAPAGTGNVVTPIKALQQAEQRAKGDKVPA
jgi:hypothetical protein